MVRLFHFDCNILALSSLSANDVIIVFVSMPVCQYASMPVPIVRKYASMP